MTSISVEQSIDQFRDRFVRITEEVGGGSSVTRKWST